MRRRALLISVSENPEKVEESEKDGYNEVGAAAKDGCACWVKVRVVVDGTKGTSKTCS